MLVPALDQYNMQRLTRPCYKGITMMALQLVTSPIAAPEALDSVPEKSIEPVGVGWRGLAWVGVGWRGLAWWVVVQYRTLAGRWGMHLAWVGVHLMLAFFMKLAAIQDWAGVVGGISASSLLSHFPLCL